MLTRPKVMAIEDNLDDVVRMQKIIAGQGYEFFYITSPGGVVRHALSLRPALIILKLEMPGEDGYAISERIRMNLQLEEIPIILTSDMKNDVDMEHASSCGIDAFIPKPISAGRLSNTIKELVSRGRPQLKGRSKRGRWEVFLVHGNPKRGKHLIDMLDLKLRKGLMERQYKYNLIVERGNIVTEGKEALAAIRKIRPDILIISDMFEGMSGWRVCEELRRDERFRDIKIILLVSRKSREIEWLRELGGVNELLYEPFHSKDLVDIVRRIV